MLNANLDALSDIELHNKLIQYGFPKIAITETTRGILIQKLKTRIYNDKNYFGDNQKKSKLCKTSVKASSQSIRKLSKTVPATECLEKAGSLTEKDMYFSNYAGHNNNQSCILSNNLDKLDCSSPSSGIKYSTAPIKISDSERYFKYINIADKNVEKNISYKHNDMHSNVHHKFHHRIVNRLLTLRDKTLQKHLPHQKFCTTNDAKRESKTLYKHKKNPSTQSLLNTTISRIRLKAGFKEIFIPYALICTFGFFILFIVFMYININLNVPCAISENNMNFTLCADLQNTDKTMNLRLDCIEEEGITSAVSLIKELNKRLQNHPQRHYCSRFSNIALGVGDLLKSVPEKDKQLNFYKVSKSLQAAVYLLYQNPQWEMNIVKAVESKTSTDSTEQIQGIWATSFVVSKRNTSTICHLYRKLESVFLIIGTGTVVAVLAGFCFIAWRCVLQWRRNKTCTVERFMKSIVHELQYRASLSENLDEKEVIINHLRDKLIPLHNRRMLCTSWNKALKLLEENDSRIVFAVCTRNGEEFRTMKWIENSSKKGQDQTFGKRWQSPAFDYGNAVTNPPTPCLKIRHMFDSSEINHPELKQVIENAILEKVGLRCNIIDIQIDKQTCCVYLHCATEADAGIVHNEINGWWFDKRLVSIKFLRLQRYLNRFPKSS